MPVPPLFSMVAPNWLWATTTGIVCGLGSAWIWRRLRLAPAPRDPEQELARLSRLYAMLGAINQAILRMRERTDLFAEACRIATEIGGYRLAWIGCPDEAGILQPVAHAGKAGRYLEGIVVSTDPDDPHGRGPAGIAFSEGSPVVIRDFWRDQRAAPWRTRAIEHGLAACSAWPLKITNRVAGVLIVYGSDAGAFRLQEVKLLEEMAADISLALDRFGEDAKRQKAEQHNRELATIVASSDDAIVSRTLEGIITSWNPGAERIYGYTAAEAVGRTMANLLLPAENGVEMEAINARLRRGEAMPRLETVRRRRDGRLIDVAVTISPLRDDDGRVIGAATVARDITQRKQSETALRMFRALIDHSTDGIQVVEPTTGQLLDVNDTTCRMLGYTRDELLGMSMFDVSANLDRARFDAVSGRLAKAGHLTIEDRHRRKDGTTFPVEVNISQVHLDREYGVTMVRDITERLEAEKALRESQALYHALVEQMPAGIYRKDAAGHYVFVNSSLLTVAGFKPDELLGRSAADLARATEEWVRRRRQTGEAPGIFARGEEHHARIMATGERIEEDLDWVIVTGRRHNFHAIKGPVYDADGRIVGSQGMLFDVTARKQAEEVLARHDAILNAATFAAGRFLHAVDWRQVVPEILAHAGRAADVSRVYVFERQPTAGDDLVISQQFEWVAPGVSAQIDNPELQNLSLPKAGLGRWAEMFQRGENLNSNVSALPAAERPILETEDIQSILVVPVMLEGLLWGLIGFDECRHQRRWHEAEVEALRTLCQLLGAAVRHQRTERTIRQLSTAVEQSPASILITDPEGAIEYANAKFSQISGYSLAEVRGRNPRLLKSGRNPAAVYQDLWATVTAGREWRGELCNRKKNGELYWEYATISPLQDEAGHVTHYVAVKEDITERKRADTALRESEYFLSKSQEVAHVGSYQLEIAGGVWSSTPEMDRIFGIDAAYPRTIAGWLDLVAPDQREEMRDYLLRRVVAERQRFDREYQIVRHHDGEIRWIAGTGELEFGDEGRPIRMIGTVQDVTERKLLEARLRRTQRLESIGTLAGGVAHDLNNILTPVLMGIPLLRLDLTGSPETLQLLDTMESSVRRGAQIIRQILIFSRGVEVAKIPLQSRQVMREVAIIVEQTFPKNITIQGRFPHDLPQVEGDATQLHQVFMNLCINARDAMPEGGTLTLTGGSADLDEVAAAQLPEARPGRYVVWTVADTGGGIKPEVLERIFEPFFTTKDTGKGTGLGLSTALGIIRSHGGFMTVSSQVGRGSQFGVYLPEARENAETRLATRPPVLPAGHGELVLIVDDEFSVRQLTEHALRTHAYRVLAADSGLKALELYRERKTEIAVVITDLIMPGMNGAELIGLLRGIDSHVKIIAVSGFVRRTEGGASPVDVVADAFLPKPYTVDDLLRAMHQVLAEP